MKQLKHLRFLAVILLVFFVITLIITLITNPPTFGLGSGTTLSGLIRGILP